MRAHTSILLLIAAFSARLFAEFNVTEWRYERAVLGSRPDGYSRVLLDAEMYHLASSSLADIRLVDGQGNERPYVLLRGQEWSKQSSYEARVLNKSVSPEGFSVVLLDLEKKGREHNMVELTIEGHNFRRRVEVYGSDDNTRWLAIRRDAAVYDLSTSDDTVRQTRVRYPASVYRYVKLHIINDAQPPLPIVSVRLSVETMPAKLTRGYPGSVIRSRVDARRKQSSVLVDCQYRNLPVTAVVLRTPDQNFYRNVTVYAGNDTSMLTRVLSDVIYRYNIPRLVDEKTSLEFSPTAARFLKIVITNNDDAPLAVDGVDVRAMEYSIVFKSVPEGSYLYFGNDRAMAPEYDAQRTLDYVDLTSAATLLLGPIQSNPLYVHIDDRPWSERNPQLLWLAFALVFLTITLLIFRLFKRGQKTNL
jgi:hypothetical protein